MKNPSDNTEQPFSTIARPGVMISNAWPNSRETDGATFEAIEAVYADTDYFEALQIVDVPFRAERRRIADFVASRGFPLTYTLTRIFAENGLNLSDLDAANRERSWRAVVDRLDEAEEAGATTLGVISGPRPAEDEKRDEALDALCDSLCQITEAVAKRPFGVLIEPLDYAAHKRCTLGSTAEAVKICEQVARAGHELGLCLDTAHMILNDDDIVASVMMAREFIREFHFCNCVTKRDHPLFGDRHLPFGSPGIVDVEEVGRKMAGLYEIGYLNSDDRPRVLCEVMLNPEMSSIEVVRHCRDSLEAAWQRARELRQSQSLEP